MYEIFIDFFGSNYIANLDPNIVAIKPSTSWKTKRPRVQARIATILGSRFAI